LGTQEIIMKVKTKVRAGRSGCGGTLPTGGGGGGGGGGGTGGNDQLQAF
jgi:hypothetical protein